MTDYWESEYKHSFKWPKIPGSESKKDAENQVEIPVASESIQTTETSPIIDQLEEIELPSNSQTSKEPKPDNAPKVKKAFAPKGKSKIEDQETGHPKVTKSKRPPEMLSYGWANNHPTVPENFMKTFNVKVPSDQVFPSTRERLGRIDKRKPSNKSVQVIKQPDTAIKDAFQQYLEAKKRLEKLQTMYKSEYQNEYLNWAEPVKEIEKASRGPAGLPSDYRDKEKRKDFPSDTKPKISVIRETASSPIKTETDTKSPKQKEATPVKSDKGISPIKSVNIDAEIPDSPFLSAHDQLKEDESPVRALEKIEPAGVSDAVAKATKEKRHYPEKPSEVQQALIETLYHGKLAPEDLPEKENILESPSESDKKVLMFSIDPPTTWRLAQDLLDRAHKRSQNLDKDS